MLCYHVIKKEGLQILIFLLFEMPYIFFVTRKFTIFPEGKMALAPSGRVLWGVPPTAPIGSIGRKDGSIIILAIGYDRLKPQFPP